VVFLAWPNNLAAGRAREVPERVRGNPQEQIAQPKPPELAWASEAAERPSVKNLRSRGV